MQLVRYLLVQLVAYGVDMGGFIFLYTHFEFDPLFDNIMSKVLAGFFAFFAHRIFTFHVGVAAIMPRQAVRYMILLTLNLPFSTIIFSGMLWVIPAAVVAKGVADILCVVLTYWLSKHFVFLGAKDKEINVASGRYR